jgi:hypothetical protein
MHSQVRPKRKFDPSSPSAEGDLRLRLDTRTLNLERSCLGQVPRAYAGINALPLLLSERHPTAITAKHAHWALSLAGAREAGVDLLSVHKAQQWETPWEVVELVRSRWQVDFDACASPLSALASRYASIDDDFLARNDLVGETIFCNPPYSLDRFATGSCAAIGPMVRKLVDGDVAGRGCTAIALLPVLSHHDWFHTHVLGAAGGGRACHEIHWISGLLRWNNPFHEEPPSSPYPYPFVLCVWRPGAPPVQPAHQVAELSAPLRAHHSRMFHLRRCQKPNCGKVRVLPRHMDPEQVPAQPFECEQMGDDRYGSCAAHEFVLHLS